MDFTIYGNGHDETGDYQLRAYTIKGEKYNVMFHSVFGFSFFEYTDGAGRYRYFPRFEMEIPYRIINNHYNEWAQKTDFGRK